jgi:type VI secretion system protein ImpM
MRQYTVPAQGLDVPAWFGKLPGTGDFAQRRLSPEFVEVWDNWLQTGLQHLRAERDDWLAYYLEAPLWFFALGPQVIGANPWAGLLMPSVDSVGRYFPLTLAIELAPDEGVSPEQALARVHLWWERSAQAALTALDTNLDATRFDTSLFAMFGQPSEQELAAPSMPELPAPGMSSWLINLGKPDAIVNTIPHLPTVGGFEVLFGYANLAMAQR